VKPRVKQDGLQSAQRNPNRVEQCDFCSAPHDHAIDMLDIPQGQPMYAMPRPLVFVRSLIGNAFGFSAVRSMPRPQSRRSVVLAAATLLAALLAAPTSATAAATAASAGGSAPRVLLTTSDGDITVVLYPDKAPKTVANFLQYVASKQYNGTVFHRVIPGFMIQGGGFDTQYAQKATRPPITLEARNGLSNVTGTIAMARTSDPDSATAQFFINTHDNTNLDYPNPDGNGYAVFGKVTAGMDVVRKIEASATGSKGMMSNVPKTPIVIESVTLLK